MGIECVSLEWCCVLELQHTYTYTNEQIDGTATCIYNTINTVIIHL